MPADDRHARLRRLEGREERTPRLDSVEPPDLVDFVRACAIIEKEGTTVSATIPFDLWPDQEKALRAMEAHSHILGVKGRQIGFTWLDLAFWLHRGTFWRNRLFLLARQSEAYAVDAIARVKILRSTLPPEWRVPLLVDNQTELRFANGCKFLALTATKRIGRGYAAYGGMADEFAFWEWQEEQLAALFSACANLHVITTGNGPDLTERMWEDSMQGRGLYRPVFIPASADPRRRSADWRRVHIDEAPEPRLAKREWAECPEDAFSAPEGVYFEKFDPRRNVQEFEYAPLWQNYIGVDFGWQNAAVVFAQLSPTGQIFVYDEWTPQLLKTSEQALGVDARLRMREALLTDGYCDPAGRGTNAQTAESEVEVFAQQGLLLTSMPSGIRDGCVLLMERIADDDGRQLVIHPRCTALIKALAKSKPHKTHPDCYDYDHPSFSHVLDALRYLVVNLNSAAGHFEGVVPDDNPLTGGLYGRIW